LVTGETGLQAEFADRRARRDEDASEIIVNGRTTCRQALPPWEETRRHEISNVAWVNPDWREATITRATAA